MKIRRWTWRLTGTLAGLMSGFAVVTLILPGGIIAQAKQGGKLQFALIGDTPYLARQSTELKSLMQTLNDEKLGFVIHDGDMWFDGIAWNDKRKGLLPCSDAVFKDRLAQIQKSKHPFILTPGDNDWTDCYRAKPNAYDPLERLTKLRQMYFKGDRSLGQRTIKLNRQSSEKGFEQYRENVRWTWGGVEFVTLHMTGSNNNQGRTPEMDAEYKARNAANLAWMHEAFQTAKNNGRRALMIVSQANPYFENTWNAHKQLKYMLEGVCLKPPRQHRTTGFDDFLEALAKETIAFGKPVVYVHGDTHIFRIDKPLVYPSAPSRFIPNFTRVETFGFPNTHWVKATIDPSDPNVFQFEPEMVVANEFKP